MESKYLKYLGLKHNYTEHNCITLIDSIYKNELKSNVFDGLWEYLELPEGRPKDGRGWMKRFSISSLETWASTVATKVNLTELQEYDVIIFKSGRLIPTHFGLYVENNRFIHLAEGKFSKIDILDQEYREEIASIWRWNGIDT